MVPASESSAAASSSAAARRHMEGGWAPKRFVILEPERRASPDWGTGTALGDADSQRSSPDCSQRARAARSREAAGVDSTGGSQGSDARSRETHLVASASAEARALADRAPMEGRRDRVRALGRGLQGRRRHRSRLRQHARSAAPGRRRRATIPRRSPRSRMRRARSRTPTVSPRATARRPPGDRRSGDCRGAKIERLPARPTGGHIATDLMGHYFNSAAASRISATAPRSDATVPRTARIGDGALDPSAKRSRAF